MEMYDIFQTLNEKQLSLTIFFISVGGLIGLTYLLSLVFNFDIRLIGNKLFMFTLIGSFVLAYDNMVGLFFIYLGVFLIFGVFRIALMRHRYISLEKLMLFTIKDHNKYHNSPYRDYIKEGMCFSEENKIYPSYSFNDFFFSNFHNIYRIHVLRLPWISDNLFGKSDDNEPPFMAMD